MTYGQRLKFIRNFRGMTQAELGSACNLGKNGHIFIAQYECGTRTPREERNAALAKALNVNPKMLMWNPDDIYESIYYPLRWACILPADEATFDAMKYMLKLLQKLNNRNRDFLESRMTKREYVGKLLQDMEEKE